MVRAMEYLRGYRVVFNDPEWLSKCGVGAVLLLSSMCIPLLGQIVLQGWQVEATKRDLRGEQGLPPLAFDMELFKSYLEPGFRHWLVQLAYMLPVIGLILPLYFCAIAGVLTAAEGGGSNEPPAFLGFIGCIVPLIWVGVLVSSLFAMYAQLRVAVTGELGKAFQIGEIFAGVKRVGLEMFLGMLVFGFVGFFLQMAGMLACFVGIFFTANIIMVASGIFRADLARLDASRGGPELPPSSYAQSAETFR